MTTTQKMFKKKLTRPPEFIYFLTYSKRVIRLLYFVDFLNKSQILFFHSDQVSVQSLGYGFWRGWGVG